MAEPRTVAICLIRHQGKILVGEASDAVKGETFYRPLGGGVNFGESARNAVIREIKEEIGAELANVRQLSVIENIFTYQGNPGHEIIFVFEAEFADKSLYARSEWDTSTEPGWSRFLWKPESVFHTGAEKLYPEGLLDCVKEA